MRHLPVKAIFIDEDPLHPRIIECVVILNDDDTVSHYVFEKGSRADDVMYFLAQMSDPKMRVKVLGWEKK